MIFLGYKKCSTSNKAENFLTENKIDYSFRDIKSENPSVAELKEWHKLSGIELKRFFNTSGILYKEQNLKEKLADMSDEEKYALLATNGLLVKRPMLISKDFVLVGFKEGEWSKILNI